MSISGFYTHQDADVHTLTKNKGAHTKKKRKKREKYFCASRAFLKL